jgi:Tol biopolymer transport system component
LGFQRADGGVRALCAEKPTSRSSDFVPFSFRSVQVSFRAIETIQGERKFMRKLAVTLSTILVIAMVVAATGCGSDSAPASLLTYTSRGSSDNYAPHLFVLDPSSQKSTAVNIPIPTTALYISANSGATAVTYQRSDNDANDIFLMGTDGSEKQLTTGANAYAPVFSPDGKTIAYFDSSVDGDYQIFTMNADGSSQTALYTAPLGTIDQFYPQFSPDGKSLTFYLLVLDGPGAQVRRGHAVNQRQPWAETRRRPAHAKAHNSGHAQIVAGPTESGWYTMALTDTTPTLVYATEDWWGPASYSADGTKLLFTLYDGVEDNIFSANLDGTGLTALTTNTDTYSFGPVAFQSSILFNRWDSATGYWDIYIMDQAGANQTLVTSTGSSYETLIDSYWSGD